MSAVIIQIVRYRSGLTGEEVVDRFEERSDRYRDVAGLIQKYYIHQPETDEYGGVYVWDSEESMQRWRDTNLAGTLVSTYDIDGDPRDEVFDVVLVLHQS